MIGIQPSWLVGSRYLRQKNKKPLRRRQEIHKTRWRQVRVWTPQETVTRIERIISAVARVTDSLGPDQRLCPLHWVFSLLKKWLSSEHWGWGATGRTELYEEKYLTFQLPKPCFRTSVFHMSFKKMPKLAWKRGLYLSVCADASCSSVGGRRVCPQQQQAGSRSRCPVSTQDEMRRDFKWKMFICLFPRCMVGQNLKNNTI